MQAWVQKWWRIPFILKVIWIFCALGTFLNTVLICRDLRDGGVLLSLHIGFLILYAGQTVFILLKERMVFVLSLLQAAVAFITNLDFTFVPVAKIIGESIYTFSGGLTAEQMEVYKYVFVSFCFTLELLKTWFLFALLPPSKKKKSIPTDEIKA